MHAHPLPSCLPDLPGLAFALAWLRQDAGGEEEDEEDEGEELERDMGEADMDDIVDEKQWCAQTLSPVLRPCLYPLLHHRSPALPCPALALPCPLLSLAGGGF